MTSAWLVVRLGLGRLRRQPWLSLLASLGVAAAVALVTAVPLYTGTIYNRLLQAELAAQRPGSPPFALLFRYLASHSGPVGWKDLQPVAARLMQPTEGALGMPRSLAVQFVSTADFEFFSSGVEPREPVATLAFANQSDIERYISLIDGRLPVAQSALGGDAVEVLLSDKLELVLGWSVGSTAVAYAPPGVSQAERTMPIPVRVVGIWKATDHRDPYWFYNPSRVPQDTLIVSEATFAQQLAPLVADAGGHAVEVAIWSLVLDGDAFRPAQADAFQQRLQAFQAKVDSLLPGTTLLVSPASPALQRYQAAAGWLTVALFALGIPVFGVIATFLVLVIGLSVRRQQAEIAILRSRGSSELQVLAMALVQGVCFAGVALLIGLPVGRLLAGAMTRAQGFLVFGAAEGGEVNTWSAVIVLGCGVAALAPLGLVVTMLPILRQTVAGYWRERGRAVVFAGWQRAGVTGTVLAVAAYGVYALLGRGILSFDPGDADAAAELVRRDPLLFAVPALAALALTLLAMRFLPFVFDAAAALIAATRRTPMLLALRQVARMPRDTSPSLILLTLTFSLAFFSASLALTLDAHTRERAEREIGADIALNEYGENTEAELEAEILRRCNTEPGYLCPRSPAGGLALTDAHYALMPRWRFQPVEGHEALPGVVAVARAGVYAATAPGDFGATSGVFVGIDRTTFPAVALWREDYAAEPLGSLMNALALTPDAVLLSRGTAEAQLLAPGDTVRLIVTVPEGRRGMPYRDVPLTMTVAGVVDGFPGWTPEQGPLFVGNLDTLFRETGGQYPYQVWLRVAPGAGAATIARDVRESGYNVVAWDAPAVRLATARARPERRGVVGMLSAGFLAAAGLTFLGMLLSTFFSFQRRALEMSLLRALGFDRRQVTALLAWELSLLAALSAVCGTAIGGFVSVTLIPSLPLWADDLGGPGAHVAVLLAWPAMVRLYALLVVMVGVLLLLLALLLRRIHLGEALKLGQTS